MALSDLEHRRARDVMTRDVIRVLPTATGRELADLLLGNKISGLPVIDDEDHVVGIATEFDLISKATSLGKELEGITAREIMSTEPLLVEEDTPLSEVARIFHEHAIIRVPVVSPDKKLVGIIARSDLVQALAA